MWIASSDGHSHVVEGQMLTNLFFSKPGEKSNEEGLLKLIHKGGKERQIFASNGGYYSIYVMSMSKISNMN